MLPEIFIIFEREVQSSGTWCPLKRLKKSLNPIDKLGIGLYNVPKLQKEIKEETENADNRLQDHDRKSLLLYV